ncbi:MAG: 5'-nucleotidase, lipoprotein e(P4) family [Bacteroidota bacterium]
MKIIIKYLFVFILLTGVISGCKTQAQVSSKADNDYLMMATLFQQKAAERRALSYQAFNMARLMFDNQMRMAGLTKTLAIIVDIDETVLDNSPFEAKSILENSDYPTYWNEWCKLAKAEPLAGSVEFLNYAKSKGAVVFYITNRKINLLEPTLKNLKDKGFPFADKEHILMRTDDSNKESRRNTVEANHHVFLLMGDNLGDFMHIFDDKSIDERFALTDKYKKEFGRRFIVLPNPMYGSWVNELFNNNFDLSKEEKIEIFKKQLDTF